MKIEITNREKVKFKNIYEGECFEDEAKGLFIKGCNDTEYNATSLIDGRIWSFGIESLVFPVNAKVVIE